MIVEINTKLLVAALAFATAACTTAIGIIDHVITFTDETHAMAFCLTMAVMASISFTAAFNRKH